MMQLATEEVALPCHRTTIKFELTTAVVRQFLGTYKTLMVKIGL
ncbi:hypothetical protein [Paenibacillus sp. IITD108]